MPAWLNRALEPARTAARILGRLDLRVGQLHERLGTVDAAVGHLEQLLMRDRHDHVYPVTVQMFAVEMPQNQPVYDYQVGRVPLQIFAKTALLGPGQKHTFTFEPHRALEPGTWVFVSGPAVLTSVIIGQERQLAPYDGSAAATVCCTASPVNIGNTIRCDVRSTMPAEER